VSDNKCTIEVNGVELEATVGQMLIEVTDAADIYVPRFCYHPKLSVAANCRMCLIDVEHAPKPLPACATPVTDGMKVSTKSERAVSAQKSVMEFLLINHPLDCPICDQGGECELQDIAVGYGRGISRFTERKRSVSDKNLGPLVSTDMTRCIHCTRCVRFGQEIAGIQELGTIGRGEKMEISTFIEQSVDHELSGNIIDLCPVGALNNKPYRFLARAWEMVQRPTVAPHDCLGSNLYAHVFRGKVKRVVPRVNESINETWASDRDRFSCEGIYAPDRLETPLVRDNGEWRACSWAEALETSAEKLQELAGDLGVLVSPSATTEEAYLATRVTRHLGSENLDYRLRRRDFRQQALDPVYPWLGQSVADFENINAALIVGSDLRREVPLLAHRIRKSTLKGAQVSFVNLVRHEYLFPVANHFVTDDLVSELGRLVCAAVRDSDGGRANEFSPAIVALAAGQSPDSSHVDAVATLRASDNAIIMLGQIGLRHPRFSELRLLVAELARLTGAKLGYIPEGANSAGLSLAGALPHRGIGGKPSQTPGATAEEMVAHPNRGLMLFGVEPDLDCADGRAALEAMKTAEFVLAFTPFLGESLERHGDIVLPMGTFAETSGTFVNAAGDWQSFAGAADSVGQARPGWKILRVLGNLLELPDCEYDSSDEVRDELRNLLGDVKPDNRVPLDQAPGDGVEPRGTEGLDVPMYGIDALVRRSGPLQETREGKESFIEATEKRKIA
jgi:NADH-quinone oxidoreductase subunit G